MGLHSFVGVWDMHMHMDMAKVLFVSYFVSIVCLCVVLNSLFGCTTRSRLKQCIGNSQGQQF